VPASLTGLFLTGVADIQFDSATVDLVHKRDVDIYEDGCIARIDINLSYGTGCRLHITAEGSRNDEGIASQSIAFYADSQCPGFSDFDEGEYSGTDSLVMARVHSNVTEVPGDNVAESCVTATFTVNIGGTLPRLSPDGQLTVNPSTIVLSGNFKSFGDYLVSCPGCGASEDCNDGIDCTQDVCGTGNICTNIPVNENCDNGVFCDGDEVCLPAVGCLMPDEPRDCSDGDPCTEDTCDADQDMCVHSCVSSTECVCPFEPSEAYNSCFSIAPTVSQNCAMGTVNYNINQICFSLSGSLLSGTVGPTAIGLSDLSQAPPPSGPEFDVSLVVSGGCEQQYGISGAFSDNTHFSGTWTANYVDIDGFSCSVSGCSNQNIMISGVILP